MSVMCSFLWKLVAGLVSLALICLSGSVHAAAPKACPKNQPPLCEKMYGAHAGCPTPCTGIIGPETIVRAGAKCIAPKGELAGCKKKLELEKQGREADKKEHESVLRGEKQRGDRCCKAALDPRPAKPLPEVPWHEKPEFVAPITLLVTGVVVGLVVAVVYETGAAEP